MINIRECYVCRRTWRDIRTYLEDDMIEFYGTKNRKGVFFLKFVCKNCNMRHEVKRDLMFNLERKYQDLLILKVEQQIEKKRLLE